MSFTLSYEEALAAAKESKLVQPDYFGSGWALVYDKERVHLYDRNPRTGSAHQHSESPRDHDAKWRVIDLYEYAGFWYVIDVAAGMLEPLEDQPPAARKDKHLRAALDCWRQDRKAR